MEINRLFDAGKQILNTPMIAGGYTYLLSGDLIGTEIFVATYLRQKFLISQFLLNKKLRKMVASSNIQVILLRLLDLLM